ncbi:hypothetical protein GC169_04010 [bacterium]|nr:hypothetical protein [bacterium]
MLRRTLLASGAGLIGAGLIGTGLGPGGAAHAEDAIEGRDIYSESIQFSCSDAGGEHFLVVRVCQYPELARSWLWAALRTPDGFCQVYDHSAEGPAERSTEPGGSHALYRSNAPRGSLLFHRTGPQAEPTSASALGQFTGWSTPDAFGARSGGEVALEAAFERSAGFVGNLRDRSEMFGSGDVALTIDGRAVRFSGPAQFHEQPQTAPRFVVPFLYASIWGEGLASTITQVARAPRGYVIDGGEQTLFRGVAAGPPAASRWLALLSEDGRVERWTFEEVRPYWIEIYGKAWRGALVRGEARGRPVTGFINNWLQV